MASRELKLAVGVLRDDGGRMLVVRKAGTAAFMQPGGKIDPGKRPDQALCPELLEELGTEVDTQRLAYLGQARATAANEPDTEVTAEAYEVSGRTWPNFSLTAEIEEARWVGAGDRLSLAPLTEYKIMPIIWQ